jgi:hypothetical protein
LAQRFHHIFAYPEELTSSVQFNYMFDLMWMLEQYPPKYRTLPLMLVHGGKNEELMSQLDDPHAERYKNISYFQAPNIGQYGTHHTKMMLLFYTTGMRVVISTANNIYQDWTYKTQGVWVSDFLPRKDMNVARIPDAGAPPREGTGFAYDLWNFLCTYGVKIQVNGASMKVIREQVIAHDFSSIRVRLVASVPGTHSNTAVRPAWGHMKLREHLMQCIKPQHGSQGQLICQFSSIGHLGKDRAGWFGGEFARALRSKQDTATSHIMPVAPPVVVFPSVENVRTSGEGYSAGWSLPHSNKYVAFCFGEGMKVAGGFSLRCYFIVLLSHECLLFAITPVIYIRMRYVSLSPRRSLSLSLSPCLSPANRNYQSQKWLESCCNVWKAEYVPVCVCVSLCVCVSVSLYLCVHLLHDSEICESMFLQSVTHTHTEDTYTHTEDTYTHRRHTHTHTHTHPRLLCLLQLVWTKSGNATHQDIHDCARGQR